MRTRLVAAFCLAAALLWPQARAFAQEEADAQSLEGEGEEQQEGGETEGADVTDQGQVRTGPKAQGRQAAPGEVHTVAKGDTLWDLSQQYLGNAWYWPKVWSYNPEIANPHWIYPGNEVRFFPGEEVPTQADPTDQTPVVDLTPATDLNPEEGTEFVEDVSGDEIEVVGTIGRAPPKAVFILRNTFVTPREVEEAGKIVGSFAEKTIMSTPDEMYVKFRSAEARVGDRYMMFKTERGIDHPKRFGRYGFLTRVLGTARVVKSGPIATLRIEETWDEIQRGDLVGPYGESLLATVGPRPADKTVDGYVIAMTSPHYTMAAETYMMVVDKGSADGVQQGNEFVVMRQGDYGGDFMNPSRTGNRDFPWEDIAVCMAVDVKEIASTCLITRSLREVIPGDRVQMRASQGSAISSR